MPTSLPLSFLLTTDESWSGLKDATPVLSTLLHTLTFDLVKSGKSSWEPLSQHAWSINLRIKDIINNLYHAWYDKVFKLLGLE